MMAWLLVVKAGLMSSDCARSRPPRAFAQWSLRVPLWFQCPGTILTFPSEVDQDGDVVHTHLTERASTPVGSCNALLLDNLDLGTRKHCPAVGVGHFVGSRALFSARAPSASGLEMVEWHQLHAVHKHSIYATLIAHCEYSNLSE